MDIQLGGGERIIWQGAPTPGVHFVPQDIFAIPFAFVWLAIVLSGLIMTSGNQAAHADPMAFVVLPIFVLVGCYMLFGRFIVDMIARRKTHYLLTDRRAVITGGLFGTQLRSINLAATSEIRLRERRNGRGTITFGSGSGMFGTMPRSWPGASQFLAPAFDGIEDARRVYDLALKAQHGG